MQNPPINLCLTLPWPPSVNHYKKVGRTIKTKSGKYYQQRVNTNATKTFYFETYMIVKQCMHQEWGKFASSKTILYEAHVHQHPPDNKRRDSDNFMKVLWDGLVRAKVIYDDSKIVTTLTRKLYNVPFGLVVVKLIPLE
jgi:Holliday junction resolvase RusA-like endonuclease